VASKVVILVALAPTDLVDTEPSRLVGLALL